MTDKERERERERETETETETDRERVVHHIHIMSLQWYSLFFRFF